MHSLPVSSLLSACRVFVLSYSLTVALCDPPSRLTLTPLRGLADDVCSMQEAKDVYPALGMIANVGLILAGAWAKFVNTHLAGNLSHMK